LIVIYVNPSSHSFFPFNFGRIKINYSVVGGIMGKFIQMKLRRIQKNLNPKENVNMYILLIKRKLSQFVMSPRILVINLLHLVYLKQGLVRVLHHRPVLLTRHSNAQFAWSVY
jgi:hypothetical protein